jgi:superfamily II DNA or RNA helicase
MQDQRTNHPAENRSDQDLDPWIEEIAEEVKVRALDRKIMLFAPTRAMARKCADIFTEAGFRGYYSGGEDRSQIPEFEAAGAGSIMCNSMLLTEGYDHPPVDCIIVLRPTKSTGLYCQMIGRGTRNFVGKDDCLILDFLWNSENNNLCKPPCLIAEDDEAEAVMEDILEKKQGKPADLISEVEVEAVSEIRCERERKLADSLRSLTNRKSKKFDPVVESLAIDDSRLANYRAEMKWEKLDMSNQQQQYLKDNGFQPDGWCKGFANQVIEDVIKRSKSGLCSPKQMRCLLKNGYPNAREMTKQEAGDAMDQLSKKWAKAQRWKNIKADRRER